MKMKMLLKRALLSLTILTFTVAFLAGCGSPAPRKIADRQGLTFGVAVLSSDLLNPVTAKFIIRHFNLIVPGDTMKWANIHPTKKFWNWSDMDALVAFAQKNGMAVKGHTFLWHDQLAAYAYSAKTRDEAIALLTEQIDGVMTHYKGKIREYDIANELLLEDGTMRDTLWYRLIGPDFLDIAFNAAHKADPAAKLIICDFNTEYAGTAKGDAMYEIVKGLKTRGVPIDGVAFQLHCMAELPLNEGALRSNIKRYNELGVFSTFSEVDVRIKMPVTPENEAQQSAVYARLMNIARTEPGAKSMILWGFTDKASWIPRTFSGYGSATVLDTDMKPKKPYTALMQALQGKWQPPAGE